MTDKEKCKIYKAIPLETERPSDNQTDGPTGKNQSKKSKFAEGCFDICGELVIELIMIAIGALVLWPLGVTVDTYDMDIETLGLVGIGAIAVVGLMVCGIIWIFKRKKRRLVEKSDKNVEKNDNPQDGA